MFKNLFSRLFKNLLHKNSEDSDIPDFEFDNFRLEIVKLLAKNRPDLKVESTSSPSSIIISKTKINFANIYRTYRQLDKSDQEDFLLGAIDGLLTINANQAQAMGGDAFRKQLLLRIVPLEFTNTLEGDYALVHRPLAHNLALVVVIDEPRTVQFVSRRRMLDWNINENDLFETATRNLENLSQRVPLQGMEYEQGVQCVIVNEQDGYDAARLACPQFMKRLRQKLGNRFYIGVPNRDFLIAWVEGFEGHNQLAEKVREDYRTEPYPLTSELFFIDETTAPSHL